MPVSRPLEFFSGGKGSLFYPGSAHILHTNGDLDLRIGPASGMFVATFEEKWIDGTAWRLTQHRHYYDLHGPWARRLGFLSRKLQAPSDRPGGGKVGDEGEYSPTVSLRSGRLGRAV